MGITVRGLQETMRNLRAFPGKLAAECLAKALNKALDEFDRELRARTPISPLSKPSTSSKKYGHLLQCIEREITIDAGGKGARASIGFGRKGFIALMVEYGHEQVYHVTGKGKKAIGDVPPHPFMRRAFEAAAARAFDVFVEEVERYMSSGSIAA